MPSLKELKNRIVSVQSTQKITKAMQMVAASKLKRAVKATEDSRPYANSMKELLESLAQSNRNNENLKLLNGNGCDKEHLVIIATSDKGLCGSFNSSVTKAARIFIKKLESEGKKVKIFCIGKKGYDSLKAEYSQSIVENIEGIAGKKNFSFEDVSKVSHNIVERFIQKEFGVCSIVYSKFISAIVQEIQIEQLMPLQDSQPPKSQESDGRSLQSFEYEPSQDQILSTLLPKNVAVQIFKALLENNASEQGTRMTAMDNATRNSGDMISALSLTYNRTRQFHITKELIEIISGAEAV